MSARKRNPALIIAMLPAAALLSIATPAASAAAVADRPDVTAGFNGDVHAVLYRGGTVYVGGDFTRAFNRDDTLGAARRNLAAVDARTGALLPWNPGANRAVYALAARKGQIFAGGDFTTVGGQGHKHLAAIAATGRGAVSRTFRASTNDTVLALSSKGRQLFAGGQFSAANGQVRQRLAGFALGQRWQLRRNWSPRANGTVFALRLSGSRVYVAGGFGRINGVRGSGHLAAVEAAKGSLVRAFNPKAPATVRNLAVTGQSVYAAGEGRGGHLFKTTLAGNRLWDLAADGNLRALTVLGSSVYFGGHFDKVCPRPGCAAAERVQRKKLAAVDSAGRLLGWKPNANSVFGVFAMASSASLNKVAAGGQFTSLRFGAYEQRHFAQFS